MMQGWWGMQVKWWAWSKKAGGKGVTVGDGPCIGPHAALPLSLPFRLSLSLCTVTELEFQEMYIRSLRGVSEHVYNTNGRAYLLQVAKEVSGEVSACLPAKPNLS